MKLKRKKKKKKETLCMRWGMVVLEELI